MSLLQLLLLLVALALAFWAWFVFLKPNRRSAKLPPGPRPLPIIGNILQLDQLPHQSLAKLSQTYGPIMSLQLGSLNTIVVSSADVAKQIFTKHYQSFSSRTIPDAVRAHNHHELSFAFMPAGTEWRRLCKLSKEHLFSSARLDASAKLRQEKVDKMRDYVQKCCDANRVVDVAEATFVSTLNLMSATLFSIEATDFDSGSAQEFRSLVEGFVHVLGAPNVADFFPVLRWIDPQGINKQCDLVLGKFLAFIQDLINKRVELRASSDFPKKMDFLETLLDLAQETSEFNYSTKDMAHLLLELLIGGSDPVAILTEWIMMELLLNPDKLIKTKQELRTVIGKDKQVQESDLARLPYFQAVIKESIRCHIPAPFLVPRKSADNIEINGHTIPKGTQLIINVWAIAIDPNRWSNPDTFEPERFLDTKIDFKGQDFEFLPFRAGIRICPGMPLGIRMLHILVASLIHNFDWKLESEQKPAEMEKMEKFGLGVRKAVPLRAIPIKITA